MVAALDSSPTEYESWEQVAGYFDGDGNVRIDVGAFVLRLGVRFADTWKPQLDAIHTFLAKQGITLGSVGPEKRKGQRPMYRLDVGEIESTIRVMRFLLPLCVKKHEDLRIALDYFEDKITGNEAIRLLDNLWAIGRRRGTNHDANLPYTRSEGLRMHKLTNAKKARDAHRVKVPLDIKEQIKEDRKLGLTKRSLEEKYGYTQRVVERVLREPIEEPR